MFSPQLDIVRLEFLLLILQLLILYLRLLEPLLILQVRALEIGEQAVLLRELPSQMGIVLLKTIYLLVLLGNLLLVALL